MGKTVGHPDVVIIQPHPAAWTWTEYVNHTLQMPSRLGSVAMQPLHVTCRLCLMSTVLSPSDAFIIMGHNICYVIYTRLEGSLPGRHDLSQIDSTWLPVSNAVKYGDLLGAWLASYGSENTRGSYRRDATVFCRFLDETGLDLLAVTRAHIDVFARARAAAGDADATVSRRIAAVSALYKYALTVDMLEKNPAEFVRRPVIDQDHSTTPALTRREAMRLLEAAESDSARSYALVDLLLSTGVRISEALTARVSGLGPDRLVIQRKGGKKALVYLPEHTAAALRMLTGSTGTELARGTEPDQFIFTTATARPWARSNVHTTLTRLGRSAGIAKTISSHVLRHTHATLALELGVPLHHLQDSLGHADPRTTRRYDHSRKRLANSSAHQVGELFV